MGTGGGDERAPQGVENWKAPNRLRLAPMVHNRIETPSIEAAPQAIPPLPTRRGMPR